MEQTPPPRPKKKSPAKAEEKRSDDEQSDILQMLKTLIKPVTDFHTKAAEAAPNDVHLFWDVRAVRGGTNGEVIAHIIGSSTMSGLLHPGMIQESTSLVENEVMTKVAQPLVSPFQAMAAAAAVIPVLPNLSQADVLNLCAGESRSGMDVAMDMAANEEDDE